MSILVITEQAGGAWHKMSWETLSAAQQLGASTGLPVFGVVLGTGVEGLAKELTAKKLDGVYVLEDPLLKDYTPDAYTAALQQLVESKKPRYVLFPHTYQVRDFAPKLATRFGQVLVSDVIQLRADGATRQLFQGKLNAEVRFGGSAACFASVQAGAYRADQALNGDAPAPIESVPVKLDASRIRTKPELPFRESARALDLGTADIIVSVGRGIKDKENIRLVEELAKALGGEVAASRPICDAGWLPMERQVGSSGQTVSPRCTSPWGFPVRFSIWSA